MRGTWHISLIPQSERQWREQRPQSKMTSKVNGSHAIASLRGHIQTPSPSIPIFPQVGVEEQAPSELRLKVVEVRRALLSRHRVQRWHHAHRFHHSAKNEGSRRWSLVLVSSLASQPENITCSTFPLPHSITSFPHHSAPTRLSKQRVGVFPLRHSRGSCLTITVSVGSPLACSCNRFIS